MRITSICLCAIFGILAACSKQENTIHPDNGELSSTSARSVISLSDGQEQFIIKVKNDQDLQKARKLLVATGAEETGYLPQLGMLFVKTSDVEKLNASGLNIAYDLEALNEPAATSDNPPSSGDNDTFFPRLWGMDAIDAPQAWNMGYRGAGATVAVLDCGFYTSHPDLAGNLLVSKGRNFVNWGTGCTTRPECDPADVRFKATGFSHGSHVAGTIAALDNNIGVIGVAPNAKIIPVKVLSDFTGSGFVSWIVQGIVHAVDNGANVINMSLRGLRLKGSGKGSNLVQEGIKMYNEAIQYAKEKGVVVICAAGNDALDFDHPILTSDSTKVGSLAVYPASSPHAICVSATAPHGWLPNRTTVDLDEVASYTNYGNSLVDIAAPGGDALVAATYPFDMVLSTGGPTNYFYATGTSMASPHVAGVAALIVGKYNGNISPASVKRILLNTADDLGKPGKDPFYGHGRVNAAKAVQ